MFLYQAAAKRAHCSILSVNCTVFNMWMPKKMWHNISIRFFVLALILRRL